MRLLLLLICLCGHAADWKDSQKFYWWDGTTIPGVALTSTRVHGIEHATGSVTTIEIGDQTGPLSAYCTTFLNCPTSIPNCQWLRDHNNIYNDTILFVPCRPLTNGITYIATNFVVGTPVVWFSVATQSWITGGAITLLVNEHVETFADSSTAYVGTFIIDGPGAISGDSGSPVFLTNGDFFGSINAIGGGGTSVGKWAYPNGSTYRPLSSSPPPSAVSVLFNRDPDL